STRTLRRARREPAALALASQRGGSSLAPGLGDAPRPALDRARRPDSLAPRLLLLSRRRRRHHGDLGRSPLLAHGDRGAGRRAAGARRVEPLGAPRAARGPAARRERLEPRPAVAQGLLPGRGGGDRRLRRALDRPRARGERPPARPDDRVRAPHGRAALRRARQRLPRPRLALPPGVALR